MPYGNINVDTVTTSTTGGILGAGDASTMKNRIINGAMVIDQRNAGASVTPTTTAFTLDRWKAGVTQSSKFSVQQVTTAPAGFNNSLKVTSLAATTVGAGDYYAIIQPIEGYNIADLGFGTANAKTITLSFQVYSSLTGTFGGALTSSGDNDSYPFTYSIPTANTWTAISVTVAGNTGGTWLTTNGIGLNVYFGLGVGSGYSGTVGTWTGNAFKVGTSTGTSVVGTNGATFYITGVQLEVGSSATGFEYRQYGTELQLCQRYYQISVGAVADNGASANTKYYYVPIPFKVSMRATPSASFTAVLSTNVGSRAFEAPTTEGGRYVVTASGGPTMADTSNVSLTSEL
jgi:hypothetical protein